MPFDEPFGERLQRSSQLAVFLLGPQRCRETAQHFFATFEVRKVSHSVMRHQRSRQLEVSFFIIQSPGDFDASRYKPIDERELNAAVFSEGDAARPIKQANLRCAHARLASITGQGGEAALLLERVLVD